MKHGHAGRESNRGKPKKLRRRVLSLVRGNIPDRKQCASGRRWRPSTWQKKMASRSFKGRHDGLNKRREELERQEKLDEQQKADLDSKDQRRKHLQLVGLGVVVVGCVAWLRYWTWRAPTELTQPAAEVAIPCPESTKVDAKSSATASGSTTVIQQ